jgi:ADP-ribose pyrophosphatase YjhB (NUDIX family)
MKYCSDCGKPVVIEIPEGDTAPRHVCSACRTIHYQNPLIVVGCLPEWEGKLLLCKRAIEPRLGYWTAPAGFMELGETLEEGAARETMEEACARVEVGSMLAAVSVRHVNQVHIMFRARMLDGQFAAGEESLEVRLFSPDEIPWQDLAFPSVTFSIEKLMADTGGGMHSHSIERR